MSRARRRAAVAVVVLLLAVGTCQVRGVTPAVALMPTADPVKEAAFGAHALAFPPALVAELAVPITPRLSVAGYFGGSWFLDTVGGVLSASAKLSITRPDRDRWATALHAQAIGGFIVSRGEGDGGRIDAISLLASSPVRPARLHAGITIHTMPGSEYPGGRYDWTNPQYSVFGAGEWLGDRSSFGLEALWGAIDADEGFDSVLLLLPAARLRSGRLEWKLTAGLGVRRIGSPVAEQFPVPPLVSLTVPLGS